MLDMKQSRSSIEDAVGEVLQDHKEGRPTPAAEYAIRSLTECLREAVFGGDAELRASVQDAALSLLVQIDRPDWHREWAFYSGMLASIAALARAAEEARQDTDAWERLHPVERVVGRALPILFAISRRPLGRSFLSDLARDDSLGLGKTSVGEHVKKLAKLGCVTVSGSTRSQSIALTPLGRRLVDECHSQMRDERGEAKRKELASVEGRTLVTSEGEAAEAASEILTRIIKQRATRARVSDPKNWSYVSSHGLVATHITEQPWATLTDISRGTQLTPRAVYQIVRDLEDAGLVRSRRKGRHNTYAVRKAAKRRRAAPRQEIRRSA